MRVLGRRRKPALVLVLVVAVPAVAIGAGFLLIQVLHIPAPGARDVPTGVHSDCIAFASVETWIDQNGNGIREDGESPLVGVVIRLDVSLSGWKTHADGISDERGQCTVHAFFGDCTQTFSSEISVQVPVGYEATTPTRISSPAAPQDPAQFGFGLMSATRTPTVVP